MKDAVATMGQILPRAVGGRDAVHVAVFSAVAGERLDIGVPVRIVHLFEEPVVEAADGEKSVGIVDPFLPRDVQVGQRVWIYLWPRTITGLTHQWTHPEFDDAAPAPSSASKDESERWIRGYLSAGGGPSYHAFMALAEEIADGMSGSDFGDEYMYFTDIEAHGAIDPEVWPHVEVVLGRVIQGPKPSYFSCSC